MNYQEIYICIVTFNTCIHLLARRVSMKQPKNKYLPDLNIYSMVEGSLYYQAGNPQTEAYNPRNIGINPVGKIFL